jgi:signal peptidase I
MRQWKARDSANVEMLELGGNDFLDFLSAILMDGHCAHIRVTGSSMHPAIQSGDRVVIAPVKIERLVVGVVVLFRDGNNQPILHRIKQCSGVYPCLRLLVKGDNADYTEHWISSDSVVAEFLRIERSSTGRLISRVRIGFFSLLRRYFKPGSRDLIEKI